MSRFESLVLAQNGPKGLEERKAYINGLQDLIRAIESDRAKQLIRHLTGGVRGLEDEAFNGMDSGITTALAVE
jgi:hypothetical protein